MIYAFLPAIQYNAFYLVISHTDDVISAVMHRSHSAKHFTYVFFSLFFYALKKALTGPMRLNESARNLEKRKMYVKLILAEPGEGRRGGQEEIRGM